MKFFWCECFIPKGRKNLFEVNSREGVGLNLLKRGVVWVDPEVGFSGTILTKMTLSKSNEMDFASLRRSGEAVSGLLAGDDSVFPKLAKRLIFLFTR